MTVGSRRLTVLHGKFAAYLGWSQPFIHALLEGVGRHVENVVVCSRTENLDRFPCPNIVRLKSRCLFNPTLALSAATHLRRTWNPDLIHSHFGWSGIRMMLIKQFLRVPMVTTFGGRDVATQMHMPHYDRLYTVLLEASDRIVCVSEDLKTRLVDHGIDGDRIAVIRRGTDLHRFTFVDRADRDADSPVRLLMVGRLVEKKGHRYVLEALARLRDEGLRVTLDIVGEGDDYTQLRQLRRRLGLQEVVHFAGSTDQLGVRDAMRAADVFLHCSVTPENGDAEGIPNVVVEAAATGLPVLGTRHGGIVEVVEHERTGLLVEERDVSDIVEALRGLVEDRDRRIDFGTAGSRLMHREFDMGLQVSRYLEEYEQLTVRAEPSTRLRRMWIPENYSVEAAEAIQSKTGAKELSLAELAESLFGATLLPQEVVRDQTSILEWCYEMRRHIPQPIKYPLKVVLASTLKRLMEIRTAVTGTGWVDRRRDFDRTILDYFDRGGEIARLEEALASGDLRGLSKILDEV